MYVSLSPVQTCGESYQVVAKEEWAQRDDVYGVDQERGDAIELWRSHKALGRLNRLVSRGSLLDGFEPAVTPGQHASIHLETSWQTDKCADEKLR